ncbi:aminoglycoside phosphotransferase family protein [Knoellia sp. S7-12]|uniref:phosphotransferase family protein n=1 Tax=Knoellia sp. S7-12 TaxID=3126698 RepID=UPI003367A06E
MIREYEPPSPEILQWVARRVHPRARVTAIASLPGGITAAMDRITVDAPTGVEDVVLRRWPGENWAQGLVAREASALAAVRGRVPAPHLIAMDEDGTETGVRCSLTSALTGQPDLAPADMHSWLSQLATTQAAIHAVPDHPPTRWDGWYDDGAVTSLPDRHGARHRPLDWLADHGLREAARDAASGPLVDERVLVHGDYQHFNVLWCDGQLSGVVDWPNAGTGNRGSDVGHCRLNLAVLFGTRTAADYLASYERVAGVRVDRRADLRALLCFDREWLRFIPRQVAGRASLDLAGMTGRVAAVISSALDGIS